MHVIETAKKFIGLVLLAVAAGVVGFATLRDTAEDTDNKATYTLAAGMRNVTANATTCRVGGLLLQQHSTGVYDFRRGTLTRQWRTHATVTEFDRLSSPVEQANLQAAYRLLPAPHSCPAPAAA